MAVDRRAPYKLIRFARYKPTTNSIGTAVVPLSPTNSAGTAVVLLSPALATGTAVVPLSPTNSIGTAVALLSPAHLLLAHLSQKIFAFAATTTKRITRNRNSMMASECGNRIPLRPQLSSTIKLRMLAIEYRGIRNFIVAHATFIYPASRSCGIIVEQMSTWVRFIQRILLQLPKNVAIGKVYARRKIKMCDSLSKIQCNKSSDGRLFGKNSMFHHSKLGFVTLKCLILQLCTERISKNIISVKSLMSYELFFSAIVIGISFIP